jgi:urea transport system substrate-binding protein
VKQAGSLEVAAVRQVLADQRLAAPEGEVRIDPANYHLYKTPRIGQIDDDGQFDLVWKAVKPVAPEPFPDTRTEQQWKDFLSDLYHGWGDRWSAPAR